MNYEKELNEEKVADALETLNICIVAVLFWIARYPALKTVFDYLELFLCPVRTGKTGFMPVRENQVKSALKRVKMSGLAKFEPACVSDFENLAYAFYKYQMAYNYALEPKTEGIDFSDLEINKEEGSE